MRKAEFNPPVEEFVEIYDSLGGSRKVSEHYKVSKTTILNFAKKIGYKNNRKVSRFYDISGLIFDKLTVLKSMEKRNGRVYWLCRCECGTEKYVRADNLKDGSIGSCGRCNKVTHGKSDTRIYRIYIGMMYRCIDDSKDSYDNISVCDEWLGEDGFINFYNWSMKNGYSDDLTIDRIDTYGDYKPSNCRWVTHKEQQNNKTNNRKLEYKGIVKNASEWTEHFGVKDWVVYYLYKKYGDKAIYHIDEFLI